MKKIIAITCITLSMMFALFSCKSTSNDNIVDNSKNNYITGTVGSKHFSATGAQVAVIDTFGYFSITGISTDTNTTNASIILSLKSSNFTKGKYYLNVGSNPSQIFYANAGGLPLTATSGIVNITTLTTSTIAGSFSCTLSDSTTITGGTFSVIY